MDLVAARHVRIAASAVFGLLVARAVMGNLGSFPNAEAWAQVIALLACAVAFWRPVLGATFAAAALVVSTALDAAGYWDVLPVAQLCLVGAHRFATRNFWLVLLALAAYGGLLAITDSSDPVTHIILVSFAGLIPLLIGLTVRHFVQAQEDSSRDLVDLTNERLRVKSEERSAVARELHDVVAQVSLTTMLVMSTSLSDDPHTLADTVDKIRRRTEAAHHELDTLLCSMRGLDAEQWRPTPLLTQWTPPPSGH